jgi:predicted ATP-binding protein involved in virulence
MAAKKKTVMKKPKSGERPEPPRSVYFLSLSVQDVRCFRSMQTLDLSDGKGRPARWTVILGNNGVGKTTLLQCLTLFEGGSEDRKLDVYQKSHVAYFWVQPHRLPQVRNNFREALLASEVFQGEMNRKSLPGERNSHALSWVGPVRAHTFTFGSRVLGTPHSGLVCYGYGATRRMGAGALSAAKQGGRNDSLFLEDVPLRNAEEWLLQADYAASKNSSAQADAMARRDRIIQVLKDLLPDIDDIRFVAATSESPVAQVEFMTPYGWVGMQRLSLGYRTLIAWMVDLASRLFERYPDSPNPLAEPAVVLVDEIDLHLHPTWQRRLIGYLGEHFPNAQFIVSAHSPLVVQSATDANIVVLRQEGDHVVIDNDVASIRGWRVDQILTSDLFGLQSARPPQLDALLAERTALLSKARLTKKDQTRLGELESEIGPMPAGETQTQREALDIIQRFAERVGKDSK